MDKLDKVLQYEGPQGFKFDSIIANIIFSVILIIVLTALAVFLMERILDYKKKKAIYEDQLKNYNIKLENKNDLSQSEIVESKPVKPSLFVSVLWIPTALLGIYMIVSIFITFTGLNPIWAPKVKSQETNMESILVSKKPGIMYLSAGLSARYDIKLPTTDLDTYDNKWLALRDNTQPKKYHWIGKIEVNNDFKVKTLQTSRIGRKYIKVLNKANEVAKLNGTELIDTQMTTFITNFNNKPYSIDTKLEVRPGQTYHIIGLMHKKKPAAHGPKTIYVY